MISAEEQQRLLAAGEHGLTPYSFLEDIKGIENFDWPINGQKGEGENDFTDNDDISDDDEKLFHVKYYRKITNFRVCDVFGIRSKAFFIDEIDPSRYFLLIGDLIPCPQSKGDGSSTRAIALKVPITEMFYNFGLENDGSVETKKQLLEDARLEAGFWVRDFECTLYQLVPPALESYSEIFEVCLNAAKSQFKPADAHFGRKIHLLENTTIHNSNEEHVNPLESKISDNHFAFAKLSFLRGSSSSKLRSIKVRIPFILWELSFGDCINNELNTGFLISNLNNHIWFKVNSTAESYAYREELSNCLDSTKAILSGCGKPHKFYDTEYRRITHFEITSYDGKVMEEALPRPKPTSTPESLIFALSGMILKSKEEIFRVRTFINDYVIDIGYRPKDEISIFTFSLDKSFYRLHWSSKCRFPKFDAVITDYHWPSEDEQVWRRIKDYKLTDVEGNDSTLLTQASLSILKAYLIPPESFDYLEDLKVQVYVEGYSIDFGQSIEDDNRGLWLRDNHENWYKVTPNALPEYEPLAKEGLVKTRKFLRLYETVVNSENPAFVEFDEKHQQYVCDYTIQDIYKLSNRKFDLAFVSDNKKFVLDNIDNVIHKGKSRKFYNSLNVLTANIVSEAQNPTVPKPKTGKEEYEKAPKLIPETSAKPSVLEASDRSDLSLIPIKRRVIEEDTAASKPITAPPKTVVPCSFCKGIKKLNHCPYANHKDGKGIEPDALARPIKRKAIDADIVDEDTVKRQKPIESTQINRLAPTPGLSARPPSTVRPFGPPRGEPVKRANSPFCNYCKGLKRSLKCTNARHRDGFPIDLPSANDQVRDSRLCPVCQSTRKACNDEKHVDGHYYPYNPARPASTSVSVARSNPSSSAAVTKPDEERTFNEEKVKEGEKKEKEKYFSHHKPRVESTDAMAEKLMPLVLPLGGAKKSPLERLRESSMHAPGVFRELTETPKFDPLDKSAKPDKSILKMVSKDWSMYELNSGFPKTTRLKFVDESSNKPLEQLIVYSHYIPSPEDVEMS